jgi:hypothetical protein
VASMNGWTVACCPLHLFRAAFGVAVENRGCSRHGREAADQSTSEADREIRRRDGATSGAASAIRLIVCTFRLGVACSSSDAGRSDSWRDTLNFVE